MASFLELCIWGSLAIFQWTGVGFVLPEYRKRKIIPYLYISTVVFLTGAFGFAFLIGRIFNNIFWISFGVILICFVGIFTFAFFHVIYGSSRFYNVLQAVQIAFFSISVISSFIYPPILGPDEMTSSLAQMVFFMLGLSCLLIIIGHYSIVSWKMVIQEKLSIKLLILPLTTILMIISSVILYSFVLGGDLRMHFAILPLLVGLGMLVLIMIKIPSLAFLVLIRPQHLAMISQNGETLYSEQFEEKIEPKLIHGAVAAINAIFNQYRSDKDKTSLHLLTFPDQIIYVEFREKFFIILIDKHYSPFVEKHFIRFADTISVQVSTLLQNEEKADLEEFSFIRPIFHQMFSFFPRFT